MRPPPSREAIAAVATPPGTGALGLLRVSGRGSVEAARSFLRGPRGAPLGALEPRRATRAWAWSGGEPLDEVVATLFPGEGSPTGEELVEVSAHGSPRILARLLEEALAGGARAAEPGEFTLRSFLNGRLDLAQAEAVGQLVSARGEAARRAALRQLEGGLSGRIRDLRAPLLSLLARVEAGLDHPDEELPPLPRGEVRSALRRAREEALALASGYRRGRLASEGARAVLAGAPNAGKSSLFNALLGSERAIVSPEPGTTRDAVEGTLELEGLPVALVDTAGLEEAPRGGAAGALAAARAREAAAGADLLLLVRDSTRTEDGEGRRLREELGRLAGRAPVLEVLAKRDLAPGSPGGGLGVSALTGEGLPELRRAMAAALGAVGGGEPAVLVTAARHHEALLGAAAELDGAEEALEARHAAWEELAASRLRGALARLGSILGEGASDEVLEDIFSRFCVGK